MPNTKYLQIKINNQWADIGDIEQFGLVINYILEEPENFLSKQASDSLGLTLPATRTNDTIFNQFWSPQTEDTSPNGGFREWMDCEIYVNGVIILKGSCLLVDASITDKPESYTINIYGNSGGWLIDAQNLTLWDCVSQHTHTFDVATVEASWAYGTPTQPFTETNDYVYAPVRYRQPFDGTTLGHQGDDTVNIYHLRPSISLYWLIIRGFTQLGYTVKSQFFSTQYFQGLVLPFVWGDFYDLNSQLIEGVCFKACGQLPSEQPPVVNSSIPFWTGNGSGTTSGTPGGSSWWFNHMNTGGWNPSLYNPSINPLAQLGNGINPTGGTYVMNGNGTSGAGKDWFQMTINNPPAGFDNFNLYEFDATTGTMIYNLNPPAGMPSFANLSATFIINLYVVITTFSGEEGLVAIECTHIPASGPTVITCQSIMPSGGAVTSASTYPSGNGYPVTPTVCNFTVPNLNPGDQLRFRIRCLQGIFGGAGVTFGIFSGGYLNNNPTVIGVPSYAYNPVTEQFGFITPNSIWSPLQSSLTMTGFLVQLGNTINFQNYDAFRNYKWTDMLKGIVEAFNLEVQTDAVNNLVSFEPMFGGTLPDGTAYDGYFSMQKILDWTNKRDRNKESKMSLFNNMERQLDFNLKQDGSDGGQNIWSARYKGAYLNNVVKSTLNNTNIENGIIAGVPGASRYMLPNRFSKGNRQITNSFFSATMHVPFPQWNNINGAGSPTPQLICIFPENTSGSSSDAITQIFEPKLAYYAGQQSALGVGSFRWVGNPANPYTDGGTPSAIGFNLPYMFAVDYSGYVNTVPGQVAPVLSYSDENINGTQVKGLMSQFYLQRLAIMRNGQLYMPNMRLNLNDICNWEHQEALLIENSFYALIGIEEYNPLSDESCECTMWKIVTPQQVDLDNSFPSSTAILTNPPTLPQYDLRYARLLLYPTDLPQID